MSWKILNPDIEQAVKAMFTSEEAFHFALDSACAWSPSYQKSIRLVGYDEISVTHEHFEILVRREDVGLIEEEKPCSCE